MREILRSYTVAHTFAFAYIYKGVDILLFNNFLWKGTLIESEIRVGQRYIEEV